MSSRKPPVYNDYVALPGAARLGFSKAYLGPDHLLTLRLRGTAEHARRFYYEDITGIRCQVTRRGQAIGGLLLLAAMLPLIPIAIFGLPTTVPAILCGIWSSLWLFAFAIHWGHGPTCATWIHTTNHTERLSCVRRYRAAQRAFEALVQRLAAAQGSFPDSEADDTVLEFTPLPPVGAAIPDEREKPSTRVLILCLSVSLVLALSYLLDYQIDWDWKNALDGMAAVLMTLSTPFAMYRCFRRDIPALARWAMGILTVYYATLLPQMIALGIFLAALDPAGFEAAAEKFDTISNLSVSDGPVYYLMGGYHTLSILIMGVCAIVGLLVLSRKAPVPSNPEEDSESSSPSR